MARTYSLSDLKESTLIYQRRIPAFGVIVTFITLVFVCAALIWAGLAPRTYVVKATGIVVSDGRVNIMNEVSGSIKELNIKEGQAVVRGDVLVVFDSFQTELQIAQIQSNIDFYSAKAGVTERLFAFINGFTLNKPESRVNPFDGGNADEAKAYSDAKVFIDYIADQEKAAAENKDETGEPAPKEYTQGEADSLKTNFLSQQYETVDGYKLQLNDLNGKKRMYEDSLAEYTLKADRDGVVHVSAGVTIGTVVQAGSLLGTISSSDVNDYYFETVVSTADRVKVKIGDLVETAVAGALQSEFGVLKGKVAAIDADSTQTENGEVYYRVRIKPDTAVLKDKKGNEIRLSTGMLGESRIKYDETTWLRWVVEQIGVKFK